MIGKNCSIYGFPVERSTWQPKLDETGRLAQTPSMGPLIAVAFNCQEITLDKQMTVLKDTTSFQSLDSV